MAFSRHYDEAKTAKAAADSIQIREEERIRKQIEMKMELEFLRLRESQAKELDRLNTFFERTFVEMEMTKEREITPIEFAIKQVRTRKDIEASKKSVGVLSSLEILGREVLRNSTTPRTRKRLREFREVRKGELRIFPVSDERFERLRAMDLRKIAKKRSFPKISSLPSLV
jgi:hypothetical protein